MRIMTFAFILLGITTSPLPWPVPSAPQSSTQLQARDVVVAEPAQGRVVLIRYGGSYVGYGTPMVLTDRLQDPRGVAVEPNGVGILVAEAGAGKITRIRFGGATLTKETVRSGLKAPYGVAVENCDGDIIVTNSSDGRLLRISADGSKELVLADQLSEPKGVAVADDGTILVVESLTGSISQVSADGRNRRRIAEGLLNPEMISSAPNGLVYVTERAAGQISEVNPQTGQRRVILGGLNSPVGIHAQRINPDDLTSRLIVTHDHEVLIVDPQTGISSVAIRNVGGTGCSVVPGFYSLIDINRAAEITASCQLVGNTLTVKGEYQCYGIPTCAQVKLSVQLKDRSIIQQSTRTNARGEYQFILSIPTQPPGSGGMALVVAQSDAVCLPSGNRCYF